jgi:superfamily II DNA or RNA helicase
MTVREGVDQGFLTKPTFRMLRMKSGQPNLASDDPNDLTRHHLFYNPKVNAFAADVANKSVGLQHRPTLILIDEIEQFTKLLPFLRYEARFAHGPLSAEQKAKVPSQYHDSEPKKLVEAFNRLEYPILVGTSCIATGTDIQAVQTCIYLRGGKSEVEVRQGVGRTTRLFPNKKDCVFLDFCIDDVETLARHAMARKEIYQDLYPSYEELKIA